MSNLSDFDQQNHLLRSTADVDINLCVYVADTCSQISLKCSQDFLDCSIMADSGYRGPSTEVDGNEVNLLEY